MFHILTHPYFYSILNNLFTLIKMHTFFQNKQSLLLLFGIFFTFSCQPNKQDSAPIPVIKADVTSNAELNLSDYFENFRMLKLPTDTLIGEIEKSNLKIIESIFQMDFLYLPFPSKANYCLILKKEDKDQTNIIELKISL